MALLHPDEPPAVESFREDAASPWVLLCDHASRRMPRALADLGLSESDLESHIAWDPGARGVALRLSEALDAPLVASGYSRLVIDANRPLGADSSIPEVTCGVAVPGNVALSAERRKEREDELFRPYHERVAEVLARRDARGTRSVLLSVHSFTPELFGERRPWHVGLLYGRDPRLARALLAELESERGWVVGDNQPYRVTDRGDYAIPVYGERAGRLSVLLELRQDLLVTPSAQTEMADRWLPVLARALTRLDGPTARPDPC
jgi:predicted N-formylglutamate amidohydrolase